MLTNVVYNIIILHILTKNLIIRMKGGKEHSYKLNGKIL